MKRFLTIALVLPFAAGGFATVASADAGAFEYGWTIGTAAGPFVNTGPFAPGLLTLKLWYVCNSDLGMAAAEFRLASKNLANVILAFTPKSGFLNAGGSTHLLLAVGGCPDAQPRGMPINVGDILILSNAPGGYHITTAPNGNKVTVDCRPLPQAHPIQWIGFSNDGTPPQQKDWDKCTNPVSVDDSSWGQIKAIYR